MEFSLDDCTCALSVGEFAGFALGPREAGQGGPSGLWRAQLGQEWHARLRHRTEEEMREKTQEMMRADAAFEVPLMLPCLHRGWTFTLSGRIDQLVTLFALSPSKGAARAPAVSVIIREIKTVAGPLPASEESLRSEYPEYFLQVIAYLALFRTSRQLTVPQVSNPPTAGNDLQPAPGLGPDDAAALWAELFFVELGTGITQTVKLTADDEHSFLAQLERLVDFLNLQLRARERLRGLQFRPAFAVLRHGQETVQEALLAAFGESNKSQATVACANPATGPRAGHPPPTTLLFEAPTGYGKTGVLLEFALGRLRAGRFARLLYLTSKSTGQLQVMRTLAAMTAPDSSSALPSPSSTASPVAVAAWQVRPKSEHCVNSVFHCVRDVCPYLADLPSRWTKAGLARFYLLDGQPRDIDSLRAAGRDALVCPYEITRTALPFNDVWIGDYNYVFSPDNRGVFFERPGFNPSETLLIIDEAHNLPSRVADAYSHTARAGDAEVVLAELHRIHAPATLVLAWEHWTRLLSGLRHTDGLDLATEDDVLDAIGRLADLIAAAALDYAALGPVIADQLWRIPSLRDWLDGAFNQNSAVGASVPRSRERQRVDSVPVAEMRFNALPSQKPDREEQRPPIPTLLWCPRAAELHFTCLDAAAMIGRTLRAFGGVILASATLQPREVFAANCGLDEPPAEAAQPGSVGPPAALGKLSRRDRKALRDLTSGAELLKVEEAREGAHPRFLRAPAPWRDQAYTVGIDTRVDTSFQHRTHFFGVTAASIAAMRDAALNRDAAGTANAGSPQSLAFAPRSIAVFFPSYAYAETVVRAVEAGAFNMKVALQPRSTDLAAQASWVETALVQSDALFLVLGSSFAESIDLLGGRVTYAMVVGPALPEVNAIQRSRLAGMEAAGLSRTAAFRRVYQIPGMQKVNQALGRLVRAPGQHARVLLHCRRFAEESYASLLSSEYQNGTRIANDEDLSNWLGKSPDSTPSA
jgi:Rad3-related DNA helicase